MREGKGGNIVCSWTDASGEDRNLVRDVNGNVYYEGATYSQDKDGKWHKDPSSKEPASGGKDKKVVADDAAKKRSLEQWEANGKKYTTIVMTDARGTKTVAIKQGVESENYSGLWILGPDGNSYKVWDPRLGALLEAAGIRDDRGNPAGYANPKAAQNEYNLARDKVVRDRAIAAGLPIPQPTGHRNKDAWGNKAPTINDHRGEKPKTPTAPSSAGTPPPAAAPGTVSTTPVTNPAAQGGTRDHRPGGNASSGSSGGVTVTVIPRPPAAGGGAQPPANDGRPKSVQ